MSTNKRPPRHPDHDPHNVERDVGNAASLLGSLLFGDAQDHARIGRTLREDAERKGWIARDEEPPPVEELVDEPPAAPPRPRRARPRLLAPAPVVDAEIVDEDDEP